MNHFIDFWNSRQKRALRLPVVSVAQSMSLWKEYLMKHKQLTSDLTVINKLNKDWQGGSSLEFKGGATIFDGAKK